MERSWTDSAFWNWVLRHKRLSRRTVLRGTAIGASGLTAATILGCGESDRTAQPSTLSIQTSETSAVTSTPVKPSESTPTPQSTQATKEKYPPFNTVPNAELSTLDGQKIMLYDLIKKRQLTIIAFSAPNQNYKLDHPAIQAPKFLKDVEPNFNDQDTQFLAIAIFGVSLQTTKEYLKEEQEEGTVFPFPYLVEVPKNQKQTFRQMPEIEGLPTIFIVNQRAEILNIITAAAERTPTTFAVISLTKTSLTASIQNVLAKAGK